MEKFNTKSKTVAKKLLAIIIVFAIIFAHFAMVGSYVVEAAAEALEKQNTITKGSNIEFDAYFEQNGEHTHTGELLAEETQKLYIQLAVKDKVSVPNATIKIEDPNFSIKEDEIQENRYVKDINAETNEIQLDNLSSNNTATIELPIQLKKQDKVDNGYFNKEVVLKLEGNYENIEQKERELKGEVKVQPQWTSNTDIKLTQSIQKYFSLGEKGTLLEQQIETQIENNVFPRSSEEVEVKAPDLGYGNPNNVTVLINGEQAEEDKIEYNQETGIVKISYENQIDGEQEIDWKSDKEVYNIMYQYQNAVSVEEKTITLSTKTNTHIYAKTDTVDKEETREEIIKPIGNIATVETSLTGDIYKGYLYENEAKEISYEENNQITVSYIEGIDKLTFESNNETYTNEKGEGILPVENIRYTQTAVNKEELISLLGEEGRLSIKRVNGEEITSIGNETQTDEAGNIVINYEGIEKDIIIETTKPQKEGKINILNKKAISGQIGQPREVVKTIKNIVTSPTISTNITQQGTTAVAELKETTSEAKIEISRENLSTINTNQDVEIKAILSSNLQRQDLYANPSIMIEFPTDVQEVNVKSIDKLYGDEFTEVRPSQGVIEGKQTIYVELIGEQTTHKESGVEGTIINIKADIKLNRKATNKQDAIRMAYSNEKAIQYTSGAGTGLVETPIEIVSPKGLITTNNIEALQIETIGEEKQVEKEIEVNSPEQVYSVESEIINNDEEVVNDVRILGTFGTKGKMQIDGEEYESNINSVLKTGLSVEAQDTSKIKIYYSENEKATEELENQENGWKEEITNPTETKKYLITVSNMDIAEEIKVGYDIEVPANLQYKQQMYQGYAVKYNDEQASSVQEKEATAIALKTSNGPQLIANLTAKVGEDKLIGGSKVKKGEIIDYILTLENVGDKDLTNIKVIENIPEETMLLTKEDNQMEYEAEETTKKEVQIENIAQGETKEINYKVRVKQEAQPKTKIVSLVDIEFEDVKMSSNEISVEVDESSTGIDVELCAEYYDLLTFEEGMALSNILKIKNTTQEQMENVKVEWQIPKQLEFQDQFIYTENGSGEYEKVKDKSITIDYIPANSSVTVIAEMKVLKVESNSKASNSAIVTYKGEKIRSNAIENKFEVSNGYGIKMNSPSKNKKVNVGDIIDYEIKIENKDDKQTTQLEIRDELPAELTLKKATIVMEDETEQEIEVTGNKFSYTLDFNGKGEKILKLQTQVIYNTEMKEEIEISNKAELYNTMSMEKLGETETIKNIIKVPTSESPPGEQTSEGTISGYAWVDEDLNGEKNDYENTVENMTVKLLNVETNEFAKDKDGNQIQGKTDNTGLYTLENVPQGEYVVIFEYDSRIYKITEYQKEGVDTSVNSKAISKTLEIEGEEKTYGITEMLKVQENSNIPDMNIGLVTTGKFDFALEKYINKITVKTNDGNVKTYNYNKEVLAKVELGSQKIEGANLIIEYKIEVKNVGEVSGYVKTIDDYISEDMTFSSELNKEWYQTGTALRTNSLQNKAIAPGESEVVTLVLTKTMTEDNTGKIGNTAEIIEAYNAEGTQDINSTPGNGDENEDDYGSADTIVGIKTGSEIMYTTFILTLVSIIGVGVYFIRKETIEMKDDIFKDL